MSAVLNGKTFSEICAYLAADKIIAKSCHRHSMYAAWLTMFTSNNLQI